MGQCAVPLAGDYAAAQGLAEHPRREKLNIQ
jgi:hypothetical protein